MLKWIFNFLLLLFSCSGQVYSQTAWTWAELDTMPMKVSNNAVTQGTVSGETYIYSFGGIDTTKIYSGITQRSFRYHVGTGTWEEISPMPSSLPYIASAASNVKNKIYVIGGYHVYSGGSEISSDEVIIYNPETNLYEPNGAPIPTPIDDQVQCVWRDSLIYVITGWSNTTNVTKVQIYDPALDQWSVGTDVPNSSSYRVFGGSGTIIGDTIYYFGGAATGFNFPASSKLRKGIINPIDPTQITWTLEEDAPNNGYRQACLNYQNQIYWVGGSSTSYNYNGIAYNGTGGVPPLQQIMRYEAFHHWWNDGAGAPFGIMDLRGVGQVSSTSWIICGGMEEGQIVTNRTFLLSLDSIVAGLEQYESNSFRILQREIITPEPLLWFEVFLTDGRLVYSSSPNQTYIPEWLSGPCIISICLGEYSVVKSHIFL